LTQDDVKAELLPHLHSDANICFGIVMAILGAQSVLPRPTSVTRPEIAAVRFSSFAGRVLTITIPNVLTIALSNDVSGIRVANVRERLVSA